MTGIEISRFDVGRLVLHADRLAEILADSVRGGALVGHILPVDHRQMRSYWQEVATAVDSGGRILLCALIGGQIAGTVQLYLSPESNAPHRGEVYKLLVHGDFRNRGIGEALVRAVEREATRHCRTLLLLDTVQGGAGERLYRRLGWQEVGIVPDHFVDPWGVLKASVYMMRRLRPDGIAGEHKADMIAL